MSSLLIELIQVFRFFGQCIVITIIQHIKSKKVVPKCKMNVADEYFKTLLPRFSL